MPARVHALLVVRPDGQASADIHLRRTLNALRAQTRPVDALTIVLCGGGETVRELAANIERAQQPEIDTMTGWLAEWDAAPLASDGAMPGMDHGAMSESGEGGMADDQSMTQLQNASGADFDRLFLQLMTVHHQGAVDMAETEADAGQNAAATALAHQIIVDQTAEIDLMAKLLDGK